MGNDTPDETVDPLAVMRDAVTHSSIEMGWRRMRVWQVEVPAMECVIRQLRHHTLILSASDMEITARVEDRPADVRLHAGHAQFMPALRPKHWMIHSAQRIDVIDFDVSLFSEVSAQLCESHTPVDRLEATLNIVDSKVLALSRLLVDELQRPHPDSALYVEGIGNALAVHMLRTLSKVPAPCERQRSRLSPRKLKRVFDFIDGSLCDEISLSRMADEVGVSPFHFARLFKQSTGSSPYRFVTGRRIERAKRLLATTDLPLVDIALEVGFSNQSRFTEAFRRIVGTTPGNYRQAV